MTEQPPGGNDTPPPPSSYPVYPAAPVPPYPQNPYGQLPYAAPPAGTNGFAIAALVLGILPCSLLAIPFGITALVQTSRSGQRGRGLAIAGLVLGGLWFVVGVALGVIGAVSDPGPGRPQHYAQPGECIADLRDGSVVATVREVPCSQPHQGEVFAALDFSDLDARFPGDRTLSADAESRCGAELRRQAPPIASVRGYTLFWLRPTATTWSHGDRHLTCILYTDAKRTGSYHDTGIAS